MADVLIVNVRQIDASTVYLDTLKYESDLVELGVPDLALKAKVVIAVDSRGRAKLLKNHTPAPVFDVQVVG